MVNAMDPVNDPDGPPSAPQPRRQAFQQGSDAGLNQASTTFNDAVPRDYTNRSVLGNPDIGSGIGMAASDRSRMLYGGGLLPSFNGTSAKTKTDLINKGIASRTRSAV
jgi:hypothetical protein